MTEFTKKVIDTILRIPPGKIATYGQIASIAGNYRAARQVVRILHSSSEKYALPWFRVINKKGQISLPPGDGFQEQKMRLEAEGIPVDENGCVAMDKFLWKPGERE